MGNSKKLIGEKYYSDIEIYITTVDQTFNYVRIPNALKHSETVLSVTMIMFLRNVSRMFPDKRFTILELVKHIYTFS